MSLFESYRGRVRDEISRFGETCGVLRVVDNSPEEDNSDTGTSTKNGYGKSPPPSSPQSGTSRERVATVPVVRTWPTKDNRATRQRTGSGYYDSDSPVLIIPIDGNVEPDDYIEYLEATYELGQAINYPTHYEFESTVVHGTSQN